MKKINVLVTGCGGDIGQSIGKILKEYSLISNLFGTDLNINHAGIFIYNECFVLPKCTDSKYLSELNHLIEKLSIDVVIPVSEAEIRFFYKKGVNNLNQSKTLIASQTALSVGLDKLNTANFLELKKFPFPKTFTSDKPHKLSYPYIAKSRRGSGSKNVYLVENIEDSNYVKYKIEDFIFQEFLPDFEEEYTCGLFKSIKGEIRKIVFRRSLTGGFSGFGEVIVNEKVNSLLDSIANELQLIGSINIQFRLKNGEPVIFEINPRFSSTVRFRDLLGFKDVVWSIQDLLELKIDDYSPVIHGKKFYKGYNEFIK